MSVQRDIAYGLHSLIPRCCVDFFVGAWDREFELGTFYAHVIFGSKWAGHYIPCPECLSNDNFVRVKDCILECGRECWKDFK